jgi:[acyl-carrier-protein] S-malonyltransferase
MSRRAVLVCPGRGTYNRNELGTLNRIDDERRELLCAFDDMRTRQNQTTLSELDGARRFSSRLHTCSENASALIYACSYVDYLDIDDDAIEIVAVTGNSMGWYTALACSGALSAASGFELVNTMGHLMQSGGVGGQLVYPIAGVDWVPDPQRRQQTLDQAAAIDASDDMTLRVSIELGSMIVLAGNEEGLTAFEDAVPAIAERFPLRLPNHAAFHTELLEPVAEEARRRLANLPIRGATTPLVDGRGAIWYPDCYDSDDLWDYTLGHQVTKTYDFTSAIRVAAREFEPDMFIVLGPGETLSDSVAQCLVAARWRELESRAAFEKQQDHEPVVI